MQLMQFLLCVTETFSKYKWVVPRRFIGTLRNWFYMYVILTSKNVYIDELVTIVNKYTNAYWTRKMKPIEVKLSTYVHFDV